MTPEAATGRLRAGVPIAASWGITVRAIGDGTATLHLPRDPLLLRPGPTVSGPALMGLADLAMWAAILGLREGRDEALTLNLAMTFLRRAGDAPILAEATLARRGARLLYGEVWLTAEGAAEPCAHATTTWLGTGG
jgi:acyl-coenzyme A thioesterase PaaI-like protein